MKRIFGIMLALVLVVSLGMVTVSPVLADATPGWKNITQVAAGHRHTVGLESDDTVVAVGSNSSGVPNVGGWANIKQVAAGGYHTVGAKNDGTVVAVGENYNGQCNIGNWTNIKQVAGGGWHTVGVTNNGTVVAVGNNNQGQCNVNNWTGINQTTAGGLHTVGLKSDGTVLATGDNFYGQCNVAGWTNIIQVTAGGYHTVGLCSNGTLVAVGNNSFGQCSVTAWMNIIQVAAGYLHTVGLKYDGTVVAVGDNSFGQCNIAGWTNMTRVAAGYYHTVGLRSSGTVIAVGNNDFGQCGSGVTQRIIGYGIVNAIAQADTEVVVNGTATVTVLKRPGNPYPGAPVGGLLASLDPLQDEDWRELPPMFCDVSKQCADNPVEIEVRFYYTDAAVDTADVEESSLRVLWYNDTRWVECSPNSSDSGVNMTDTTIDGISYSGYIWAKIRGTGTSPTLSQMCLTEFGGYGHPSTAGVCFIATAAYGTDRARELDILREFRDEILLPNSLGAKFVSLYYRTSPPIANFISRHESLKTVVRTGLVDPVARILNRTHALWSGRGS